MAISKKYRSYGVRRLNNLSDIENPEQALNNLLDNLQPTPGESFISQDLDAIRGLKDTEIFPSTFIQLASTAPKYTFANTLGPQEDFILPYIRLQDKINIYRSVTGNPGILRSGMGPDGWTVPVTSIMSSVVKGSTANTIIPNFDNDKSTLSSKNDFWTLGEFYISNKFDLSYEDKNGGIIWEGYFTPEYLRASPYIAFDTTGLFHFEVDRFDNGNWQVLKSIYHPTRTLKVAANTTSSTVQLATGDGRFVAIGDKLVSNNEVMVESVAGDVVTLTNDVTLVSNADIGFTFEIGEDYVSGIIPLETAYDLGETFKTRVLWWYPNTAPDVESKYLRMSDRSTAFMLFSAFSNTAPTGPVGITKTINDAVNGHQRFYGDDGQYRTFISNGVIRSRYTPKSSFGAINTLGSNTAITATFTTGRTFLTSPSNLLSQTSVGNIVIDVTPSFNSIQKFTQIKRVPDDDGQSPVRIMTKPALVTGSKSVKIVDHNGLMDYFITTSSGSVVTVDSTKNIRKGMACVTYYTSPSSFTTITNVTNSTSFSTSSPLGITSNNYIFVYADSGLIDSSKDVFCSGVIGKTLTSEAASGATVLNVSSNTGLSTSMRVQYSGGIEPGSNITITAVGGNQVTLSSATTSTIVSGATITFAPSVSTGDKQQCVIPFDLSPPFVGADYGLDSRGKRIVGSPSANLAVTALSLSSNTAIVSSANTTDVFDTNILINGIYKIKARQIM